MTQVAHTSVALSIFLAPDALKKLELLADGEDTSTVVERLIRAMAELYEVDIHDPARQKPKRGRPIWLENERGGGCRRHLP